MFEEFSLVAAVTFQQQHRTKYIIIKIEYTNFRTQYKHYSNQICVEKKGGEVEHRNNC